jgi:hypothetical protein
MRLQIKSNRTHAIYIYDARKKRVLDVDTVLHRICMSSVQVFQYRTTPELTVCSCPSYSELWVTRISTGSWMHSGKFTFRQMLRISFIPTAYVYIVPARRFRQTGCESVVNAAFSAISRPTAIQYKHLKPQMQMPNHVHQIMWYNGHHRHNAICLCVQIQTASTWSQHIFKYRPITNKHNLWKPNIVRCFLCTSKITFTFKWFNLDLILLISK